MSAKQRERRKSERRRRIHRRSKHAGQALAAASVVAAGTQAYAVPVRFDNAPVGDPAHFTWGGNTFADALYIQLPAAQQGNTNYPSYYGPLPGPRSFRVTAEFPGYYSIPARVIGLAQTGIQSDTGFFGLALGLSAGQTVPDSAGVWEFNYYSSFQANVRDVNTGASLIPEGVPAYLSVRIGDLAGGPGFHYGWVGVVRTAALLDAFAWGYETQVGVPVAAGAPEPGSLAMLAFGAAALAGGRKRRRRAN